jgi:hypothetical protein
LQNFVTFRAVSSPPHPLSARHNTGRIVSTAIHYSLDVGVIHEENPQILHICLLMGQWMFYYSLFRESAALLFCCPVGSAEVSDRIIKEQRSVQQAAVYNKT